MVPDELDTDLPQSSVVQGFGLKGFFSKVLACVITLIMEGSGIIKEMLPGDLKAACGVWCGPHPRLLRKDFLVSFFGTVLERVFFRLSMSRTA